MVSVYRKSNVVYPGKLFYVKQDKTVTMILQEILKTEENCGYLPYLETEKVKSEQSIGMF